MFRLVAIVGVITLSACAGGPAAVCAASAEFASGDSGGSGHCAAGEPVTQAREKSRPVSKLTETEYCTPENGFRAGARGETYAGVCSGEKAQAFLARYAEGERMFELQRAAGAVANEAADARKELWRVKRRIMEIETARISTSTPAAERAQLGRDLKSLFDEKAALEVEVEKLEARKAEADARVAEYRKSLDVASEESAATSATRTSFEP